MSFYRLFLGALVVWRLTHLLVAEDGPWDLVVRLRRRAGEGFWGGLLDCFYCLSLWVAAPMAALLGDGGTETLLLWPALSAASILLERATGPREPAASPAPYFEEGTEDHHELLRRRQKAIGVADRLGPDHPESGTDPALVTDGERTSDGAVSLHR